MIWTPFIDNNQKLAKYVCYEPDETIWESHHSRAELPVFKSVRVNCWDRSARTSNAEIKRGSWLRPVEIPCCFPRTIFPQRSSAKIARGGTVSSLSYWALTASWFADRKLWWPSCQNGLHIRVPDCLYHFMRKGKPADESRLIEKEEGPVAIDTWDFIHRSIGTPMWSLAKNQSMYQKDCAKRADHTRRKTQERGLIIGNRRKHILADFFRMRI